MRILHLFLLLSFSTLISQETSEGKSTICLNMIVKNESAVIERCINSVKDIIDYWVIVDTGSTDGTQNLIKETLKDIPGELHEKPWVNFEHNRNEALRFAENKADYLLLIDADEKVVFSPDFTRPKLDLDYYFIQFEDKRLRFSKVFFINMHRDWQWIGTLHEKLSSETAKTSDTIPTMLCVRDTESSARSQDPLKYQKDAQILEDSLKKDPNNSRNVFYLAQSYLNAKESLKYYEQRAAMEGWDQETFWSLFMVAKIQEDLKFPFETIVDSYSKTFQYNCNRAEPLLYLSQFFIKNNQIVLAHSLAKLAATIPYPKEEGYIEPFVYDYASKYIQACTAHKLQNIEEATPLLKELHLKENLPDKIQKTIQTLLKDCLEKN